MQIDSGIPNWHALTVRPKHEQSAAKALRNQDFEVYVPVFRNRRQWSDRVRESDSVLFPGYVFARFAARDRLRVLQSPGVKSIVAVDRIPARVSDDEIHSMRELMACGKGVMPWPYLRIGQRVVVGNGPLENVKGIVMRVKSAWRVVVSVEALGASVSIEVDSGLLITDTKQQYPLAS